MRNPYGHLAPPIQRTPIGSPQVSSLDQAPVKPDEAWMRVLRQRNAVGRLLTLSIVATIFYFNYMVQVDQGQGLASIAAYTILTTIMSYFLFNGLVKSLIGLWAILFNAKLPCHPKNTAIDPAPDARVAILYPVYNEDVARVVAGMEATWESLEKYTPAFSQNYDVFLLSDSRKQAYVDAEAKAVEYLREKYPQGRFYYRHRISNIHAKIGNMTDFCRRWGSRYKYMCTMDADSIMSGHAIHSMLRMMEGRPRVGILQTNPKAVFRQTIFGRMQQFAGNIFGRAFSASLQETQLGSAVYMGHNALVRIQPFIDHCILPALSGKAPWGGKPLSHDIVESALMAAHGYETWFLSDLAGSWEEVPANILASLIRERRWMQGNLQHGRLLSRTSVPMAYKEYFANGIFAYASAPLWAAFLPLSVILLFNFLRTGLTDPDTAQDIIFYMTVVGLSTLLVFLIIRFLSISLVMDYDKAKLYGGRVNLMVSVVLEFLFSVIYSPIVMMAMSRFIYMWARQKPIKWDAQDRGDGTLPWRDCWRHFGWMTLVGLIVAYSLYRYSLTIPDQDIGMMMAVSNGWFNPYIVVYWMAPVLTGIILAPLIVRESSKPIRYFEVIGLFAIPEEIDIPAEFKTLVRVEGHLRIFLPAY